MDTTLFAAKGINLSFRIIDGIAYVYLEDSKLFMQFNEVASFIFTHINGKRRISEIINNCVIQYEGDDKEIEEGVVEFVKFLMEQNMVVLSKKQFEGVMENA